MVGEYYILLSANTPLAHSLCSYACPHTLDGQAVYVVSLSSKSARFLQSHAGTLAQLTPGSLSPTLPLVARAFPAVSLCSDFTSCGFILS